MSASSPEDRARHTATKDPSSLKLSTRTTDVFVLFSITTEQY